jgi:hypothetical protein
MHAHDRRPSHRPKSPFLHRVTLLAIALFFLALPLLAAPAKEQPKDLVEAASADLRQLITALEAYSTDIDFLYAAVDAKREGTAADLEPTLVPIYLKSIPKIDPWGHPYRYVISDSRRSYVFYSAGPSGTLETNVKGWIERLRHDQLDESEFAQSQPSTNLVYANGAFRFLPAAAIGKMKSARPTGPQIFSIETDTPQHLVSHELEILEQGIEFYLRSHDSLPKELSGKTVPASKVIPLLPLFADFPYVAVDPWKHDYEIAISPSGRRTAIFSRGEDNTLSAENDKYIHQILDGTLNSNATIFSLNLMVTPLVARDSDEEPREVTVDL